MILEYTNVLLLIRAIKTESMITICVQVITFVQVGNLKMGNIYLVASLQKDVANTGNSVQMKYSTTALKLALRTTKPH